MNYDFSNHTSSKKHSNKNASSRPIPGWLWMLIGLLIGGLAMFMMSPTTDEHTLTDEELLIEPTDKQTASSNTVTGDNKSDTVSSDTNTVTKEDAKKPTRFEFYTILSEQEVMVQELQRPSAKAKKAPNRTPKTTTTPKVTTETAPANSTTTVQASSTANQYRLQAGSFQKQTEAKRLAEKIRSQGLSVTIEESLIERNNVSQTWHRVMVGPFTSSDDVLNAEENLAKQGIKSLLIKRK